MTTQHYHNTTRNSIVHNVDSTVNNYKTPLPKRFHLPIKQATMWDLNHSSSKHTRRPSEVTPSLLSNTLHPYQPISGRCPLTPQSPAELSNPQQIYRAEPDESPMQHLVLIPLGKTGAGKSSLLNIMLGAEEFTAKAAAKSVTDCITEKTGIWTIDQTETIITVADTPGFADSMNRDEMFNSQFQVFIEEMGGRLGIDAFLLIFQCSSSTDNVIAILDHFDKMMLEKFTVCNWWDHVMLVFTRVDYFPNLKFPPNILSKKQSITEVLIPAIQSKYNLKTPPKYAFVSSKPPSCSYGKKGQCDCFAAQKYHLDQMRTLRTRINAILVEKGGRWTPSADDNKREPL